MTKQTNGNNWNGMSTDKIKRWGKRALTTTAILGTLGAGILGYNNLNTKIDNLSNQKAAQTTQVSNQDAHQATIDSLEQVTNTYEAQIDSLQNKSDILEQRIDANNFVIDLYHGNEPVLGDTTALETTVDTLAAPDTTTQDTTQTPSAAQDSTTQRLGLHIHSDDPHSILYNTDKDAEDHVDAGPAFQDGLTFSPAGDPFTYTIQNVNGDVDLIAEQENTGKTTPTFSLDNNSSWLQQPEAKAAVKHYLSQDRPDMTAGEALQFDRENKERGQQTMTAGEALQYDMENKDRGQQTMTAAEAFAYDVDNKENQRNISELPSVPADSLDQALRTTTEDPQYTTQTDRSIEVGPTFNTRLGAGINAGYDLGKTEIGTTLYPGTTDNFNETSLSEIEGPGRISGLYGATENVESADITTRGGTLNLSQRLFETNGLETNLGVGAGLEYQTMTGTSSQNLLEATSPNRIQEQEGLYTNQELNTSQIDRDNIRSLVRLGLQQELSDNLELNGGVTITPGKDINGEHTSPGIDLGLIYKF